MRHDLISDSRRSFCRSTFIWTRVLKLHFQLGSVVHLDVRLYKTTARGLKVVGVALFDVGDVLQNLSGIQIKQLPFGGVLVAEVILDRDAREQSNCYPTSARFCLSTVRLANPEAQISDTRIKISKMIDHEGGLRVKLDRFGNSMVEFDTQWNWPIRISVYDTRTGVELGHCHQHLRDLLNSKKLTMTDDGNKVVGHVDVSHFTIDNPPDTIVPRDTSPFHNNVCIAIDFTKRNGAISDPNSFHALHPAGQMNAYQSALRNISKLFSSKQTYTPWGVGARIEGKVRPIFQCGPEETVSGSDGIQGAYLSFLSTKPHLGGSSNTNGSATSAATTTTSIALDCVIQAASQKQARVVVVLLSDLLGFDAPKFLRHCLSKPKLRVILVTMREHSHKRGTPMSSSSENVVFLNASSL